MKEAVLRRESGLDWKENGQGEVNQKAGNQARDKDCDHDESSKGITIHVGDVGKTTTHAGEPFVITEFAKPGALGPRFCRHTLNTALAGRKPTHINDLASRE